jgi:hypothetical protein
MVIFPAILLNMKITGEKIRDKNRMIGENRNEKLVAFLDAYILGQISPNTSSSNTTMMVDTVTAMPVSPRNPIATAVATDAARILTYMFPIRMVMRKRSGFFFQGSKSF